MRTSTTIHATAILLLALLGACRSSQAKTPERAAETHTHSAGHVEASGPAGEPADYSVYELEGEWRDQDGAPRTLASLGGRVRVVAMVYTSCTAACPRMLVEMMRIERAFPEGVGMVLVSIDPERDTPGRMKAFAETNRLDSARWTLLNGAEDEVLELAAVLGIKYRREGGGHFSHSNEIIVLDERGVPVHRQPGPGIDREKTFTVLRALLGE